MHDPAGDLALGEIAVAVVHRLEPAAVDGDAVPLSHADPRRAGLADGGLVVASEVGDGLVVGARPMVSYISSILRSASRRALESDGRQFQLLHEAIDDADQRSSPMQFSSLSENSSTGPDQNPAKPASAISAKHAAGPGFHTASAEARRRGGCCKVSVPAERQTHPGTMLSCGCRLQRPRRREPLRRRKSALRPSIGWPHRRGTCARSERQERPAHLTSIPAVAHVRFGVRRRTRTVSGGSCGPIRFGSLFADHPPGTLCLTRSIDLASTWALLGTGWRAPLRQAAVRLQSN